MFGVGHKCWSCFQHQSLLLFGITGLILSFAVFLELGQCLLNHTKSNWSPLRLVGYLDWLPVSTHAGAILATQAGILTVMYFMTSFKVVEAYVKANYRLVAPWYLMHGMLLMYQAYLIYNYEILRRPTDIFIVVGGAITNLFMLVTTAFTLMEWVESAIELY